MRANLYYTLPTTEAEKGELSDTYAMKFALSTPQNKELPPPKLTPSPLRR